RRAARVAGLSRPPRPVRREGRPAPVVRAAGAARRLDAVRRGRPGRRLAVRAGRAGAVGGRGREPVGRAGRRVGVPDAGVRGGGDLSACTEVFAHAGDGRVYAAGPEPEAFGLDTARSAWVPVRADDEFRASAEVLFRDGFWSWYRWGGRADARLLAADPAPPH